MIDKLIMIVYIIYHESFSFVEKMIKKFNNQNS